MKNNLVNKAKLVHNFS